MLKDEKIKKRFSMNKRSVVSGVFVWDSETESSICVGNYSEQENTSDLEFLKRAYYYSKGFENGLATGKSAGIRELQRDICVTIGLDDYIENYLKYQTNLMD